MWNFDLGNLDELQPHILRIIEKKERIEKLRPLPKVVLEKLRTDISLEWTYNSNAIEGNTLSLRETQLIIQEGITIGGKLLREHFEVLNHEKALNYVYDLASTDNGFRGIDILNLHDLVLKNIDDEFCGRLRNGGVRIMGANFTPPNANKVSQLFDELIDFVNENPSNLNDIVLSTIFHHKFVWIHPFFDGNGRTVRLSMNLYLMQKGFPPAVILKNDRKKYYEALNQANNGDYHKLCLLILQALERSLNIYLGALPGNSYDYEPIANLVKEPDVAYGQEYISLLARRGKIDAYKEGRDWLTTKEAINNYIQTRKKKR